MAEEKISDIDDGTFVGMEKSKVDQESDKFRGDSDDISGGSFSEGDDNIQRRGSDDQRQKKGRRPRRLKGGKRHNRKHHPYAGTSYPAKKGGDALQCPRAPRNTTQYLIDDHVRHNISPDLSNRASPASNCDETMEGSQPRFTSLDAEPQEVQKDKKKGLPYFLPLDSFPYSAPDESPHYDQEFVAVYDDVNQDRLRSMSKEDLILITSKLLRRGVERGKRTAHSKEETDFDKLKDSPNATPLSSCN